MNPLQLCLHIGIEPDIGRPFTFWGFAFLVFLGHNDMVIPVTTTGQVIKKGAKIKLPNFPVG